jgi:hypothetical protein
MSHIHWVARGTGIVYTCVFGVMYIFIIAEKTRATGGRRYKVSVL